MVLVGSLIQMKQNPLVVIHLHLGVLQLHGDFRQKIIARSTMELRFVSLEMVGSEVEWSNNFLANIL